MSAVLPIALLASSLAAQGTEWTLLDDFEGARRAWTAEAGPSHRVRAADEEAYAGRRCLAVTMADYANEGKSLRQTWATDVGDTVWTPESRLRFYIKGSELAQRPHGGIIVAESGGREGGGNSYWFLPLPPEVYAHAEWEQYTSPPVSEARDPGWRPDADGKLDASRIGRLVFVAQQEAPEDLNVPFTFYIDDLEVSHVQQREAAFTPATVEDAWSDGADVGQGPQEYTMCIEAAPEVGDEKLTAYCRAMRDMGYYVGLYENFTDYNPLGKSWDERNAARGPHGEMIRVWPPTYAIRPLKALEMALDYPRRVREKFGTNAAYRDCHTAYPPWGQVDFQAGSPGAGKFATNFKAWGELLRDGSEAYGGPIFSEGIHHWFSAGLVDGNYAQMGIPNAAEQPLLLDFDLLKLHPLEADIAMGTHWRFGKDAYHGLAYTIAYGHIGFQPAGNLDEAFRYYHLIQQLQSRYVMEPVEEILYHRDGELLTTTEALKTDANESNQVLVRYENGLEVAVNCNAEERWPVELAEEEHDLSPCGWAAVLRDEFEEYSTEVDGRRVSFVRSPEYIFADAGGEWRDFGPVATDGCGVVRPHASGGREVIVMEGTARIAVEAPAGAKVVALGEEHEELGEVQATDEDGRLLIRTTDGAVSYVVR